MLKQLGINCYRDILYFLLTVAISLFVFLIFYGALYQIITGKYFYNPWFASPVRMNIQFPYFLGVCVFFMAASIIIWLILGIFSILYKRKPDSIAISEDKLISVIIPACNEENVIENILADLVCQRYMNLEILVVAHNCQDNTVNKARMINDEKVKVIDFNTTGSGKALALNEGLTEARGEIIVQFDADNRIKDPYFLSKLLSYFEKDPELAAVQSRLVASNPKDSLISLLQDTEYEIFSAISWSGRDVLKLPCFLAGTGVALRKKTLEELGGWHNSLVEDFELFTRLSLKKKRICFADNLEVFDEKPVTWVSLIKQRSRWVKGHLQVTWDNIDKFGNIIDFIYRISPLSVFAWWLSMLLYLFYFVTGQFSVWNIGNLLWVGGTLFFQAVLVVSLYKRGQTKKIFFVIPQWFFGFHWTIVAIASLGVKSWSQTKTIHYGRSVSS